MKNYALSGIAMALGPVVVSGGYGESGGIKIDWDEDFWDDVVGADGEMTRFPTANRAATITLTLMNTSKLNDSLQAIAVADDIVGLGAVPLLIKDTNGTSLYAARHAWVKGQPSTEFMKKTGERQWKIRCANLNAFSGGA